MKLAYYTILRYCPDPVRGESVNAGVLVVGNQTYRLRLIEHVGQVRRFMPAFDPGVLAQHRTAVDAFFRQRPFRILLPDGRSSEINRLTRDVLVEFTRRFSGPLLHYSPVARVEGNIDSTFALETLRDDLFEQFLVRGDHTRRLETQRKERVKTILRNEFESCDFFNAAKYHHPMAADRDIALERRGYELPASFSFDNGALHVFEPIDALDHEGLQQLRDVSLVALVFHELRQQFGDRVNTYACLVRPPGGPEVRELRILQEFATTIVDMSNREAKEAFYLRLHALLKPRGDQLF